MDDSSYVGFVVCPNFSKNFPMPHEKNTKLKIPHSPDDLRDMEERLLNLARDLRGIITGMRESDLESVPLKAGTFKHYLDFLEENVEDFKSEFEKEKKRSRLSPQIEATRESKRNLRKKHP